MSHEANNYLIGPIMSRCSLWNEPLPTLSTAGQQISYTKQPYTTTKKTKKHDIFCRSQLMCQHVILHTCTARHRRPVLSPYSESKSPCCGDDWPDLGSGNEKHDCMSTVIPACSDFWSYKAKLWDCDLTLRYWPIHGQGNLGNTKWQNKVLEIPRNINFLCYNL